MTRKKKANRNPFSVGHHATCCIAARRKELRGIAAILVQKKDRLEFQGRRIPSWLTSILDHLQKADDADAGLNRLIVHMLDEYEFALALLRLKIGVLEPPGDSSMVHKLFPRGWEKAHEGPLPEGFWDLPKQPKPA